MSSIRMAVCATLLAAPLAATAQQSTFRCQGADGKKHYGTSIPAQCYGRQVDQLDAQGTVIKRIAPDTSQSTFRCQGADGKKYYGSSIPAQCYGRQVEQLDPQGAVIKRIDTDAASARQAEAKAAAKAAEKTAREKAAEIAQRESTRRNRALLDTYSSEKDLEEQRARALADNQKAMREQEARVAELKKKRAGYDKEMAFYQDRKDGAKLPPRLQEDIRQTEFDLRLQQDALDMARKQADTINAKYDDDRRRYVELSTKTPAAQQLRQQPR